MRAQPLPYRYTSVSTGSYEPPLFNFFLDVQSLKRFGTLVITNLNLDKENPMLHNIIRKCTIRELRLDNCETDSAVLLARFITSFPALRIRWLVVITFRNANPTYTPQRFPIPTPIVRSRSRTQYLGIVDVFYQCLPLCLYVGKFNIAVEGC